MADVYVTCSVSPCQIVHTIDLPPFQMDADGAASVTVAIVSVWLVGWAARMIIRALSVDESRGVDGE